MVRGRSWLPKKHNENVLKTEPIRLPLLCSSRLANEGKKKLEGGQLTETQNCLGRFLFKWYLMLVFHLFQLYCQFRKRRSCIRVFQPAQFHYFVPVTTQTLCMVCWATILFVHNNSSFACYLKPLHLVSFWKREFLDLGSGLLE